MFNASGAPQTARDDSDLRRIRSAQVCDVSGDPLKTLSVKDGSVEVAIAARLTAALHVK